MHYENINQFTYGAYTRKSSESEDRQVQSIERQVDDLLAIQNKEQLELYEKPIEESKSAFSVGREGFNRLVKFTEQGKINAWLCWHVNRLSRNPMDAGMIIYLMDMGKLHHIRTPSRIFYNTPSDKMMLQFEFTMSKKDSDDKSVFVKSGLEKRYQKGYPNGPAPLGFQNDKSEEKGNRGWLVDKKRFKKVRLLFEKFLERKDSISSLHAYAKEVLKLTTPIRKRSGGDLVSASCIEHVLKNPIYAGYFYANSEDGHNKTRRELNPSIPHVINERQFDEIQNILGAKSAPKRVKHKTLYHGLIKAPGGTFIGSDLKFQVICDCKAKFSYRNKERCPQCSILIKNMKSPNYLKYTYYYNVQRRKTKGVVAKTIEESHVENAIVKHFKEHAFAHPHLSKWALHNLNILKESEIESFREKQENSKTQIQILDNKKKRLLDLYIKEHIEEKDYSKELRKLNDQIKKLNNDVEEMDWVQHIEKEIKFGQTGLKIFESGSFEDKRELLEDMSSNLTWNEKRLNVLNPKWLNMLNKGFATLRTKNEQFEPKNIGKIKGQKAYFETSCPRMLCLYRNVRTELLRHIALKSRW